LVTRKNIGMTLSKIARLKKEAAKYGLILQNTAS